MDRAEIMAMEKDELIERVIDTFAESEVEQIRLQGLMLVRAEELGVGAAVETTIARYRKEDEKLLREYRRAEAVRNGEIVLVRNKNGEPIPTIENFLRIMREDEFYKNVRFNLLTNRAETHREREIIPWSDTDTSESKLYIEAKYHIHHEGKHGDALRIFFKEREFHPIVEIVNTLEWDGTERIGDLLHRWLGAEDTPYVREVSRLIFAGGINRLYRPGCKFDEVPVLIGTRQGEGKSSFVRWLAINDSYYAEVTEIEGQKGIEQLEGAWVCEIAELLALTRAKEQEAVKAYITRQRDKYRRPYDRQVEELPRRCIFVATTNNEFFLRDKTGNRRFYPVKVNSRGYNLFDREKECREYIVQCWAEARAKFERGEMPPYADRALLPQYREAQEYAMEDDWRVGAIIAYLERKRKGDKVCIRQIAHEALSPDPAFPRDPTKADANEIAQIMAKMEGWEKQKSALRIPKYGTQRCWVRTGDPPFDPDDIPFDL